jgi:hypothetical protein
MTDTIRNRAAERSLKKLERVWTGKCHVCWKKDTKVVEFWSFTKPEAEAEVMETDADYTAACCECVLRAYATLKNKAKTVDQGDEKDPSKKKKDLADKILSFFDGYRGFDSGFWSDVDQECRDTIMKELRMLVGPGKDDVKKKKRKAKDLDRKATAQPLTNFVLDTLTTLPKDKATGLLQWMAQQCWKDLHVFGGDEPAAKRLKADGGALLKEVGVKMSD